MAKVLVLILAYLGLGPRPCLVLGLGLDLGPGLGPGLDPGLGPCFLVSTWSQSLSRIWSFPHLGLGQGPGLGHGLVPGLGLGLGSSQCPSCGPSLIHNPCQGPVLVYE